MATLCAIALLLIGTLHQASAGRQVLQAFTSLPAVAGTATWAPAAPYSSSRLTAPLPSGAPSNNPFGTMTNIFAASSINSGSLSDSSMRKAAPASLEAPPTMFDTTKRYIGSEGPQIQGLGIVTAVGAGNTPGAKYATQQRTNGLSSIALPMGQDLPAFPNNPIKPPTLIMNKFPQQHQGQMPQLPGPAPGFDNTVAPTQAPQWPSQLPQLSLPPMPQLGSLGQLSQPQLPPSLIDIPSQMQRFAQAASEGNIVKAIEDVGDFVRNSISNVTAAADSIITATNGVIASLPKNFTIPGELGKLINSSVDMTANVLKNLPKPNGAGQTGQPPSMARLGISQQAGNMLSQLSLPRLPGLDSLQLPRFPGMNVASAGSGGSYGSPVAVASATANNAQVYGSDAAQFWADEQPDWVTKAMGDTTASPAGSTTGNTLAGNGRQPSRASQKHNAAGAAADSVGTAVTAQQQSKGVVVATPRMRTGSKRTAADPWVGSIDSTPAVASSNMRIIPATTVPLPGSDISVSDAAAAAAAAAVAGAPVVAEPRVRAGVRKASTRKAETVAPAAAASTADVPAAEKEEPVVAAAAAAASKPTAAAPAPPVAAAAPAAATEPQVHVVADAAADSGTPAAAPAPAAAPVAEESEAASNAATTAVAAPAAAVPAANVTAGPNVTAPVAAAVPLTPAGSQSSSSSDAVKAPSTADTTAAAAAMAPAASPSNSAAGAQGSNTSTLAATMASSSNSNTKTVVTVASSEKPVTIPKRS